MNAKEDAKAIIKSVSKLVALEVEAKTKKLSEEIEARYLEIVELTRLNTELKQQLKKHIEETNPHHIL